MSLNPKITDWRGKRVWLVGASTGIGRATAGLLHSLGAQVMVSARGQSALESLAQEHSGIQIFPLDVCDLQAVDAVASKLYESAQLDLVLFCAGVYQALRAQQLSTEIMAEHMQVNFIGAVHVTQAVLPRMLAAKQGHLSYVSSVAGFRGLPNALAYGPTKAALINWAETLYLDVHSESLGVSLINPGFVETPLTAQNKFPMPALISPSKAASEIVAGWQRGDFEMHFPRRFTMAMKLLRIMPTSLYFRFTRRFTGMI